MGTCEMSRLTRPGHVRLIRLAIAAGGVAAAVAVVLWLDPGPVEHVRVGFSDWLVRMAPKPDPGVKFGLLLIDSSSMDIDHVPAEELAASPELRAMAEGWPWPRSVHASAIRRILDAGARLVILDILLLSPREGDDDLRQVLRDYPGQVILVSNFVEDVSGEGHTITRYQEPLEGDLPEGTTVGFANFWRDSDGVVRSAPFRLDKPGGRVVYSSPAVALGLLKGPAARDALPDTARFLPCMEGLAPDLRVPVWQIFSPATWEKNLQGGRAFEGRVVAIGASAPQFHDEFATPVGQVVGAGLHLGALGAAMEEAFYTGGSPRACAVGAVIGGAFLLGVWLCLRGAWARTAAMIFTSVCATAASIGAIPAMGWMPPVFGFLVGVGASTVALLGSDLIAEGREKLRARRILERYVSPEITREILDSSGAFLQSLGGTRREVTVLFSDLRGFTAHAENGDPSEVFDQLNEYFSHMVGEILRSGGWVDKFMGDGILAVWGTLQRRPPAAEAAAALECARSMRTALATLNTSRSAQGLPAWKLGIGIHSGPVLFGNLGTDAKMEPTVIGDTVNLASRIEGYTKALGTNILFSATTCPDGSRAAARAADRVRLLGRQRAVDLFTFWPDGFEDTDRARHEEAVSAFRQGMFEESAAAFRLLLDKFPEDPLALRYIARCEAYLSNPPPAGWDGTVDAVGK